MFQSIDWLKTFQPKEISELALHPKKLEELQNWFKISCAKVPNKILLLEGPTGCGKTTALKMVAKEQGFSVSEFINATDMESHLLREHSENQQREFESISFENQISKFSDFLVRTSRFQSVFGSDKERLLLIKDLPNTFLKKTDEFWRILREYAEDGDSPLVFILTETNSKSLNISYNLFPETIRFELGIDSISFNAVSATMMKRGIKRIVQLVEGNENYRLFFKRPSDEVIESLIEQCTGDIRNAVLNLSFASQQSNFKISVSKTVKPKRGAGKKQKTSMKTNDDAGIGKNEVLSLMHGLGRVLHPKLEMNEQTKLQELTHKPETITESFQSQPSNFIKMIHSNYVKNFSEISEVSSNANILSLVDCIENEYRDINLSYLNLNLVIRSTMVLNEHPASGFRPISAYANKKFKSVEEKNREKFICASKQVNNGNMLAPKDFFCDYNHFMKIIQK